VVGVEKADRQRLLGVALLSGTELPQGL